MPPKRLSRNAGKTISIDDETGPSTVAAAGTITTRSKAAAPESAPKPKPVPAKKSAKGKEKVVTIEDTTKQIEGNQNLASDTQADYVRKTNFISRCLHEKNIQKLVNQPDKVISYIIDRYPNLNNRTGYLTAWVSLIKHSTLQVSDSVQQTWFDAMMKSANAVQEINKDNVHKVDEIMLNGKRIVWKDILNLEAKLRKEQYASKDHLLVANVCLVPPRRLRDFCKMEAFKSKSEYDKTAALNKIWVDTRNKAAYMSISEFKTFKDKGTYTAKITGVFYEIIKISLAEHKRKYLFQNTNGDSYTSGTFSKLLTDTFKRNLHASVGLNSLRHLKITDFNKTNPSVRQREQLAWEMGNYVATQQAYNQPDTDLTRAAKEAEKNAKLAEIKKLREIIDSSIKKISSLSQELSEL